MRFSILAVYPDQRSDLLISAGSLREGCSLALRIADEFGSLDHLVRPQWIRLTEDGSTVIEISIFLGGLDECGGDVRAEGNAV